VLLALCAGCVNVAAYRSLGKVFVSHMTGTTATVGMRIEGVTTGAAEPWDLLHTSLLVGSFVLGSFLCGLVVPKGQVHFGGKSFYGIALVGNSVLLVAAAFVAPRSPTFTDQAGKDCAVAAGCLAAMACGLQNAMCTMHFGAVVRTTHVTGTVTDIGSTAGRAAMILLRRGCRHTRLTTIERAEIEVDAKKLQVLLPLLAGFLLGCMTGAFLHNSLGVFTFLVPAGITGTSGAIYMFFRTNLKTTIKRLEERKLREEIIEMEDCLERAHSYLQEASSDAGGSSTSRPSRREFDLDEMDNHIEHALEVMHDVEAAIADLYEGNEGEHGREHGRRPAAHSSHSPRNHSPARGHHVHG